jgi:serine/threonine-protein kinase
MSNQSGTIGKYQIIREIARSNDIVYEAYDPLMNRRVALKELMMPPGATAQQRDERIKRFLREARAAGTLSHPNIMTVYEAGEADGRHFIAMEYLDGCTLRNEIDTKGFLPIDRAVEIGDKILNALEYAHKNGVIHRDIKPENIQLLTDGRIKLTDFGIARLTFEPNLTMDGQVFGTPSYMSPEQVVGRDIDQRSDLFSMGAVIYEMVSGQKPFLGDSVVSITYAIMNKEPDRPAQVNFALWQFLQRALDKSPQMRFPSAHDMQQALHDAQNAVQPGSPVIGGAPPLLPNQGMPALNPYLPPQPLYNYNAPPQVPQISQQGQPIQTPYNPYQASPQPAPGAMSAPAPLPGQGIFAQQVYQPQYTPGGIQPPANMPIYYPPPPRVPLVKPETRVFLGRLLVTLMVMGTLIALILVGINALGVAAQRAELQRQDEAVIKHIDNIDVRLPTEEKIAQYQKSIDQLKSSVNKAEQNRQLAVLYQSLANEQSAKGDPVNAEKNLQHALELDPTNAAYYTSLGKLYGDQALLTSNVEERLLLWQRSSDAWIKASELETVKSKQKQYAVSAAAASYNYARNLASNGSISEALDRLYTARRIAPTDCEAYPLINNLIEEIRR